MSIHVSGDGYGTHDACLVYEARCPECQLDYASTIRLIREPIQPPIPTARKAAVLDAVAPRPPWWRRQPVWLVVISVMGMFSLIAMRVLGMSGPSWPVAVAGAAALSAPVYGAAARWRERRR